VASKSKPEKIEDPNAADSGPSPGSTSGSDTKIELNGIQENETEPKNIKSVSMAGNKLKLEASSPGLWGNSIRIRIDYDGISQEVSNRYGLGKDDLFNLTVYINNGREDIQKERFQNLSIRDGSRRVDKVLLRESQLIRVSPDGVPDSRPQADGKLVAMTEGKDSADLNDVAYLGDQNRKSGIYALEKADLFNLLCIPPDKRDGDISSSVYSAAMAYCVKRRAMLIVDPPAAWSKVKEIAASEAKKAFSSLGLSGIDSRNAALYFPRVIESDPLQEGQLDTFAPCGIVAGVMARTDRTRGVWKAPAGLDATLNGISGLDANLTNEENGMLNPLGINCLRSFPITGKVIWGARTLRGADQLSDEYKYIPVRRLVLYIEESLYRGTQWVVFEPNDEPLWAQIRLNVGSFMHTLFRQGAFQGKSPNEAYFVKCDKETTTQDDINKGIVNIVIGFAPLKPAEFVVIKIQQIAGQIQT
jgi:hypothetical protein